MGVFVKLTFPLALFSIPNVSLRMGNGNAATDQTQPILELYEFPNKR